MEGNTHINSYTWEPNKDGTITIHFNAEGKKNNITSSGKEFNYIVRNYGASQAVIDKKINPVKPDRVAAVGTKSPKMRMTTEIPPGITTPDKLETSTRALTARPSDQRHYLYPGERVWTNPFFQGRCDFLLDGERLL